MNKKRNPQIVVAAVIEHEGRVLIGKRKRGKQHAGKWEFPGGTLEEGETREECLKRELMEELGIEVKVGELVCSCSHDYTRDWTIQLEVYRTQYVTGHFALNDHDELAWVRIEDLPRYDFPEADELALQVLLREPRHLI